MLYRVLLITLLILWLLFTLAIVPEATSLVSIRFSSGEAALWFFSGVLLAILVLMGVARSGQPKVAGGGNAPGQFNRVAAELNEGIVICNGKGRIRWRNAAAQDLLIGGRYLSEGARALLERAKVSKGIAMQNMPIREGVRLAVQAFPLGRGSYALLARPLQSETDKNSFYESFIRRIVHDMRNPLAAIVGHAANMHQSPKVEAEAWRKSAATIENEAQRLARLVDSMLFDARLAYVPLEMAPLDLVDVIEEAVYTHDELAQQEGKTLEVDAPSTPMKARGDRDLLARAFLNLIDNSLKYSEAGATVRVKLEANGTDYLLSFMDNGIGIPAEYLPDRIFEPLVRARPQGSGSGLGLSIARKIFEMHGGGITAQSTVGVGTTMMVRLPKPAEDGKR
jgi:two-component system phosphate regulon sensor histidine kinase PhoR